MSHSGHAEDSEVPQDMQNFASSATMIPDDNSAASLGVGTMPEQPGVLIVQEGP